MNLITTNINLKIYRNHFKSIADQYKLKLHPSESNEDIVEKYTVNTYLI